MPASSFLHTELPFPAVAAIEPYFFNACMIPVYKRPEYNQCIWAIGVFAPAFTPEDKIC